MTTIDGEPIQIIKFNLENKEFELDLPVLEKILLDSNVRDRNIAIVSIAGALRKGKSFMLSFLLRYLDAVYEKNQNDWLGDEDTPLSGFAWRGGFRRHTTGIWIWSKVFTKTLTNGEKIGVILMDTQGTFDNSSTMKDNITIFSLSTMLSSVQIYNLLNTIQEDNLQHLQLFTEYGKLAIEQSSEKPFQKLLFLIRDWSFPYESPYGFEGGQQVLNKILSITDDQENELKYVRTHLKSCYEQIDCFLMPYPGIIATASQDFNGKLRDIDIDFRNMLKELVPGILSPETIWTKKVNGSVITGSNLISYIETYLNTFKSSAVPTAQTILMATAKVNMLSAKDEATAYYRAQMDEYTGSEKPYYEFNDILSQHNSILNAALEMFKKKAIMGDEIMKNFYNTKLKDLLQGEFLLYLYQNQSKLTRNKEEIIDKITAELNSLRLTLQLQQEEIIQLHVSLRLYSQRSEYERDQLHSELIRLRHSRR